MSLSVDDAQLRDRIERALRRDGRLSSQKIAVHVEGGHVRLEGKVQSYRRKLAATQVAASFEGCRDVSDDLTVQPSIEPDEAVVAAVRASLDSAADITAETIAVSARSGVVTLTGHVGVPWERALAQDIALGVRGVREIENQVIVDPASQERDEALAADLLETLRQTRGLGAADVHVTVNSAAIVLSGEVDMLWQKEAAEAVAARYMPYMLRNEIAVKA